jgi:nicotinic acid phosphoribosyltransferase
MQNVLAQLYKSSLVLLTDFYQLTMAYGYWKAGMKRFFITAFDKHRLMAGTPFVQA